MVIVHPSSDGAYYGVMMSVRPSGSPSVRPSFPHFSPTCFPIWSWNFAYVFALLYYMSSICVNFCRSYAPFELRILEIHRLALFSYMPWRIELKCCTWLCYTVLQIKFKCRQFASIFEGVMPLLNLEYWKYTVFRTFLLHALTYWAEILHMTLFYCPTDELWVSSICINV